MRILLDECVNAGVRAALPGHEVRTVSQMGWRGLKDETLLANGQRQFDVFVTIDQKLEREHDLSQFKMGFIVVRAPSNEINSYRPMFSELRAATESVKPGEVVHLASAHEAARGIARSALHLAGMSTPRLRREGRPIPRPVQHGREH